MKQPKHYTRSLVICQGIVTVTYTAIGIVVYYYCGSYVASPALGSAGVLLKKVAYGFALPGLIVTTCLYTHVSCQYHVHAPLTQRRFLLNTSSFVYFEAKQL